MASIKNRKLGALVLLALAACSSSTTTGSPSSTPAREPAPTNTEAPATTTSNGDAAISEPASPTADPQEPTSTEATDTEPSTTESATTESPTTVPATPAAVVRPFSLPGPVAAGTHSLWSIEPVIDITIADGWSAGWSLGDDTAAPLHVASLQHPLSSGYVRLTFWTNVELLIDGAERADLRAYVRELIEAGDRTEREVALGDGPATRFDFTWTGGPKPLIPLQVLGIPVGGDAYTVQAGQPQHWIVRDTPFVQTLVTWTVEDAAGADLEAEAASLVEPILTSVRFSDVVPAGTLSGVPVPPERQIEPAAVIPVSSVELWPAVSTDDRLVLRDQHGVLYAVDPATNQVAASQQYPVETLGLAVGHDALWLAGFTGDVVRRVDPTTLVETAVIPVDGDPTRVAVDGDFVWSADHRAGTVSRIDPETNTVDRHVRISGPGRGGPQWLHVDGDNLWVQAPFFDQLTRVDTTTGALLASIELRVPCGRMAQAGRRLFVGSCDTDLIHVIDTETNTLERTIGVAGYTIDGGGYTIDGQVWFTTSDDAGRGRLVAIDAATLELVDVIALDSPANGATVAFGSVWLSGLDGALTRLPLEALTTPD